MPRHEIRCALEMARTHAARRMASIIDSGINVPEPCDSAARLHKQISDFDENRTRPIFPIDLDGERKKEVHRGVVTDDCPRDEINSLPT